MLIYSHQNDFPLNKIEMPQLIFSWLIQSFVKSVSCWLFWSIPFFSLRSNNTDSSVSFTFSLKVLWVNARPYPLFSLSLSLSTFSFLQPLSSPSLSLYLFSLFLTLSPHVLSSISPSLALMLGSDYRSFKIVTHFEIWLHHTCWETTQIVFCLISNMCTLQESKIMEHHKLQDTIAGYY